MRVFFRKSILALLILSLAILSGCGGNQSKTSYEKREPQVIIPNVSKDLVKEYIVKITTELGWKFIPSRPKHQYYIVFEKGDTLYIFDLSQTPDGVKVTAKRGYRKGGAEAMMGPVFIDGSKETRLLLQDLLNQLKEDLTKITKK